MTAQDENLGQRELARLLEIAQAQRERDDAANERRWASHLKSNDERWELHMREHAQIEVALDRAASTVEKALTAALADHHREHDVHDTAHAREHQMNAESVASEARSIDKRLEGMNEFRDQLRDQARTFSTADALGAFQVAVDRRFADTTKHTDERYEENRRRIEAIEKGDVKQEGKSLGQGAVIAIIVGAIGLVGTILGIVIVIANFATGAAV